MKKSVLVLIIVGLIVSSFAMLFVFKPSKNDDSKKGKISIDSKDLFASYLASETKSDSVYFNQELEVSGIVTAVSTDSENYTVTLEGDENAGVVCALNKKKSDKMPDVGDECTVKGICNGYFVDVNLSNCTLEK